MARQRLHHNNLGGEDVGAPPGGEVGEGGGGAGGGLGADAQCIIESIRKLSENIDGMRYELRQVHCVLQHVAACCSVLQRITIDGMRYKLLHLVVPSHIA